MKPLASLILCVGLGLVGCGKNTKAPSAKARETTPNETKTELAKPSTDVCQLIGADEMSALLGLHVKDTTASSRTHDQLFTAQCFYTADEMSRSVSLTLTASASNRGAAHAFWQNTFHPDGDSEKREGGKEEGQEGRPPRPIANCGEDAFWTAGSLYALKGDQFIRVSVGGPDTEEQKLEKSKAIAAKVFSKI